MRKAPPVMFREGFGSETRPSKVSGAFLGKFYSTMTGVPTWTLSKNLVDMW